MRSIVNGCYVIVIPCGWTLIYLKAALWCILLSHPILSCEMQMPNVKWPNQPILFVGAISQVQRNGNNLNLGADAKTLEGIEMYDACQTNPCYNGARCIPSNHHFGWKCICPEGFTGSRCEARGQQCSPGKQSRDKWICNEF